jgi:hypothetical protein
VLRPYGPIRAVLSAKRKICERRNPLGSGDTAAKSHPPQVGPAGRLDDRKRWQQFFDSYWKLIHGTARKAGPAKRRRRKSQETLITVAKK